MTAKKMAPKNGAVKKDTKEDGRGILEILFGLEAYPREKEAHVTHAKVSAKDKHKLPAKKTHKDIEAKPSKAATKKK